MLVVVNDAWRISSYFCKGSKDEDKRRKMILSFFVLLVDGVSGGHNPNLVFKNNVGVPHLATLIFINFM